MSWLTTLLSRTFSSSSYPFPVGAQNNDGFERNADNPLHGVPVEHAAMRLSAVWACVRLLSQTIASLPLNTYERGPQARRFAPELGVYDLLHNSPDGTMTAQSFWEAYVSSMLLRGNAYAEKKRGTVGQVGALMYLHPDRVKPPDRTRGERGYIYTDPNGSAREIVDANMFHTLGYTLDGSTGVSPVAYGAQVFFAALSGNIAAANTFRNGLMPTVGFKMDQILKKEQRDEFRDNFKRELAGAMNAGKPPLLEGGMSAIPMGINPKDAQLLESRAWSVEEICRWFGVPPFMVGHSEKSTSWGTGIEQQNIGFLTYALRPWLTRIEQSIKLNLLTPVERKTFYAEFAVEGLLRTDTAARTAFYASAAQNGYMNRSTIAQLENLPAVPGGEVFTVQSNLIPLDMLGETPADQTVQDAVKQWLGIQT